MLELGKKQTLQVIKKVEFGVYLAEKETAEKSEQVLLPAKQVPAGTEVGDKINVFLYKDSSDRPIATVNRPLITLGKTAVLKVKEVGRIGAFLDWGLEKDLLLPFREQTGKVKPGDEVLVALYLDKSQRLCATMKVYHYLHTDSAYEKGDQVEGRVYEISPNFGVFVAVDDCFSALIPKQNVQKNYRVGEKLNLFVTEKKEDGKLTVSTRRNAYLQMNEDAELLHKKLQENRGRLNFDDKASPEKIKQEMSMSKAAFKRAVGHLLKEQVILLKDGCILLKEDK
ncbi:MAG: S1-like domain-containing RNA-binding protein [Lachnospiraceae bacterium]|nr:S1-like domain-containing RNA-binding protein [Lachnospiraceae bacterium]